MVSLTAEKTDEARVRELLDGWADATRARDIDAIMAAYAPDILAFDAIAQLQFQGADAYRKHWEACLSMCPGATIFEIHDLNVTVGDDVAFAHYLLRCGATGEDGREQSGYMRATVCCRRIDGRWLIVHEHYSAPFDVQTGKAMLELEPERTLPASAA